MAIESIAAKDDGWFGHVCRKCKRALMQDGTMTWVAADPSVDYCDDGNDHEGIPVTLQWVSAYELNQHYGGPEEGGWWYDSGELLATIPCLNDTQVNEAIDRLRNLYEDEYKERRRRTSAAGDGADLSIIVEDEKGADWSESSHYE